MAVPKKRTSKSKKNARKSQWKQHAKLESLKALSLASAVLSGRSKHFVYISKWEENI
uniref:Large ribosomal subunit protein bL32c n=1 Tax=Rhodochaete parvula TaxID=110510 RepID=A0A1C9CIF7_9RHOD|nr:ribosomal protein L32 [Rhodochaete parvula]ARO91220.1 50S ribosomal protein L32 [Rhodochaete parvula]